DSYFRHQRLMMDLQNDDMVTSPSSVFRSVSANARYGLSLIAYAEQLRDLHEFSKGARFAATATFLDEADNSIFNAWAPHFLAIDTPSAIRRMFERTQKYVNAEPKVSVDYANHISELAPANSAQ